MGSVTWQGMRRGSRTRPGRGRGLALGLGLAAGLAACLAYEPLRPQAATDFGCSTTQIEVVEQEGSYQVSGCGQWAMYSCVVDNQGLQHCTPEGRTERDTVNLLAPRTLQCARRSIHVEERGDGLYNISGCGRQDKILCQHGVGYQRCARR